MEAQFGVIFDVVALPEETKKKVLQIRNDKIKSGEYNYTETDAIVHSINIAFQLLEVQKQNKNNQQQTGEKNGKSTEPRNS